MKEIKVTWRRSYEDSEVEIDGKKVGVFKNIIFTEPQAVTLTFEVEDNEKGCCCG